MLVPKWAARFSTVRTHTARGSHHNMPCTSICDGDQKFWSLNLALDHLILSWNTSWSLDLLNYGCSIVDRKVTTPSNYAHNASCNSLSRPADHCTYSDMMARDLASISRFKWSFSIVSWGTSKEIEQGTSVCTHGVKSSCRTHPHLLMHMRKFKRCSSPLCLATCRKFRKNAGVYVKFSLILIVFVT